MTYDLKIYFDLNIYIYIFNTMIDKKTLANGRYAAAHRPA